MPDRIHCHIRPMLLTSLLVLTACGAVEAPLDSSSEELGAASARAPATVLFDWCDQFESAIKATATNPGDTTRLGAILHAAIFDAVNGIARRYEPLHESDRGPASASTEAAAAQAAHDVLISLFPAGTTSYDALLATQLAGLDDRPASVARGRAWGSKVAADILAWRAGDGRSCDPAAPGTTCPNVLGSQEIGRWRPVPPTPAGAAAALPQFVHLVPFALQRPDQFLELYPGPPPLDSPEYAASVNESKAYGSVGSARSEYQTQVALFYADNAGLHWNRIAQTVARAHPEDLVVTARLFAQLNVALVDAAITVWTSKYKYNAWRPYHAIHEPTQYNAQITPDPSFVPLVTTPNHQEYGSGHSTASGAAAVVLARHFGDDVTFVQSTDTVSPLLTSTTRTTTGFSTVSREVDDARVFGGIHFRFTVDASNAVGILVGEYVVRHAMRGGERDERPRFVMLDVPGGTDSEAFGLNDLGQIVGRWTDANGVVQGFRRQTDGRFEQLSAPDASFTAPVDINNAGAVVGRYLDQAGASHGFALRWGRYETIDYPGAVDTRVRGIDDLGRITGDFRGDDGVEHGFVLENGQFRQLDFPGSASTDVWDVNDQGRFVGDWTGSDGTVHAYTLENGRFRSFDYPGPVVATSARRINAQGNLVGVISFDGASDHGFLRSGHRFRRIDVPGSTDTDAMGINASGVIVGNFTDGSGQLHGFVLSGFHANDRD